MLYREGTRKVWQKFYVSLENIDTLVVDTPACKSWDCLENNVPKKGKKKMRLGMRIETSKFYNEFGF